MSEKSPCTSSEFPRVFANALAVYRHAWRQLNALEDRLDQELKEEFEKDKRANWLVIGSSTKERNRDRNWRYDETDDVDEYMWWYDIKKRTRGAHSRIGRLYCRYILVPRDESDEAGSENVFVPYFSCTAIHKDAEGKNDMCLDDLPCLEECESGVERIEPLKAFRHFDGLMGAFQQRNDDGVRLDAVAMYIRLDCITSSSLSSDVVPGIREVARQCFGDNK